MKTQEQWFAEYAVSHQNETNLKIHKICVPLIFWSIAGLLVSIPSGFLMDIVNFNNPYLINWASIAMIPVLYFYLRLALKMAIAILIFSALCIYVNFQICCYVDLVLILK